MSLRKWRVGYFVLVDVEAVDGLDAVMVGEKAAGWPGDWNPPHEPVFVSGKLNGNGVTAEIVRSQALMVKPLDEGV